MMLIGMSLESAKALLEREGMTYEIVENNSDKCTCYDANLVTNAVIEGTHCVLTYSRFLLEAKEE